LTVAAPGPVDCQGLVLVPPVAWRALCQRVSRAARRLVSMLVATWE